MGLQSKRCKSITQLPSMILQRKTARPPGSVAADASVNVVDNLKWRGGVPRLPVNHRKSNFEPNQMMAQYFPSVPILLLPPYATAMILHQRIPVLVESDSSAA
ncbi:hypothetical protein TNCV_1004941 [Trichonephila clavipes]|nr:hypothetical protein TNCV_1004941 [Trichonephila clavipes]